MKKLQLIAFVLTFGVFTLTSCDSKPKEETTTETTTEANAGNTETGTVEEDVLAPGVMNDIIQSIPSPLEVSILIKDLGTDYHKDNLSNPDLVDNYTNNYKKALNLGVYSTDLGYANIYEKNQDALNYLNSVKKLADGLNIGQFFDYTTIKKLTQSNKDLDSLLQLTTQNFEKINTELRKQKREYLSILILTGGWLEANYITSLVFKESNNTELREKIGEQKLVLGQILLVLNVYKNKPNFSGFIADLEELQKVYENVEIVTKKGQSKMEVVNGEIVITDTTETVVNITDSDVQSINSLVASIRNKIISN
ncbi:hypothetical protein [Bernardetia litoralis]|nr:hypothetical protein [Bernardetia litoralis]